MASASEIWTGISDHAAALAEQAGKAVVAVDSGHRVAASGVHWKPGVIVTASHLVRRASEVKVLLPDGVSTSGTVVGRDGATDIAAVRITEETKLPTLQFTQQAKVGEVVMAIARSGRGELSASIGIVARIGASWQTWRGGQIERLIRPDVRLYPGQSGSVLVNARGEAIGINSAVLARASVITVPVETVDRIVAELLERGHVAKPYIGVAMQAVPLPEDWRSAAANQEYGLLVMHVTPEGPAQKAGINLGDVIVSAEGEQVSDFRKLYLQLGRKRTGEALKLRALRSGKPVDVTVELGDRPRV
jgi:S1-C subfamily serine protease